MSEIKVGDLARIVNAPGYCECRSGMIFCVSGFEYPKPRGVCQVCGGMTHENVLLAQLEGADFVVPIHRLRRIPPLWELDETEHKEELTA